MKLVAIIEPGETIADACKSAQEWADACQWPVIFIFNGVHCVAQPGGDANDLADRQARAQRQMIAVDSLGIEMVLIDDEEQAA